MITRLRKTLLLLAILLLACVLPGCRTPKPLKETELHAPEVGTTEQAAFAQFEAELDHLREELKIPALSAAIVRDQELIWAKGLGYADPERQIAATPETPYPLASLTKPMAATIIMQLVEEGVLSLEDPILQYGIGFGNSAEIEVRHVLSHTSHGQPGEEFSYNGDRFAELGYLIRNSSGRSFRELLEDRILEPLDMTRTAPNPISMGDSATAVLGIWLDPRNARIHRATARPYRLDWDYSLVAGGCPDFFTPAAGLAASVVDMAKFDIALDRNLLVLEGSKERMFAPTVSTGGVKLPYGIGWFTQEYEGARMIWHYGWQPSCSSSLILKMPDQGLTFIALANSDNLSRPFRLGSGEVLPIDSSLGLAFYKTFIFGPEHDLRVPEMDWEADEDLLIGQLRGAESSALHEFWQRELLTYRKLYQSVGRTDWANKLLAVYEQAYPVENARLDNYQALLELGAEPWIYLPMPGMNHLPLLGFFLLTVLSVVILWPTAFVVGRIRWRRLGLSESPDHNRTAARIARWIAVGAVACCLTVILLYITYLSGYPATGVLAWRGGTVFVKSLIGFANLSVVLGLVLAGYTIAAWRDSYWTARWRVHYTLITIAILGVGVLWGQLSLLRWG